jgi:3'-phosphoadenosine 5'-phosphosulfate sulfotransferase (PAPS reductase)/FAD synthetase
MSSDYCSFCGCLHCTDHSLELQEEIRRRDYRALSPRDKAAIREADEREEKALRVLRDAGYRITRG